MAIRKWSKLQLNNDARTLVGAGSSHSKTASLADFQFNPEPGFLYVTTRAISSRVNANYDGWPPDELRNAYRTFIGRPVYVDHNNWDLSRSRGVVIDSKLYEHKLASGHEDVWVELLIEVDAQAFPKLAQSILDGDIDSVSMGADVEYTVCSVCDNKAHDVLQYCAHIPQMKGREIAVGDGRTGSIRKLCYEDCYGVSFFEISFVFDPADESALINDVMLAPRGANRALGHVRRSNETIANYSRRLGTSMTKVASVAVAGICTECGSEDLAISKSASRCNYCGVVKQADKALMSLPQPVDTLRDELNCPQCGSEWNGMVCLACGFELPPEGLGDPVTDPMAAMGMGPEAEDEEGEGEEEEDADEEEEDSNQKKSAVAKEQSGQKEELRVSRFDDMQKHATLPVDPPYRQDSFPGTSAEPYGQVSPEGNQPEALEPALELAPAAITDVRDLDDPAVVNPGIPDGNPSEVDVVEEFDGPTDIPPPGAQVGEALNSQVSEADQRAASKDERRADFYRARAAALRERADEFEKKAETVTRTDVRTLDEPPAVDVGPDATMDVLKPIDSTDQLTLADTPDQINDGRETGVPDVRDRLPQQFNPFNDASAFQYGQPGEYPFGTTNVVSSKSEEEGEEVSEEGTQKDASVETSPEAEAIEAKEREEQRIAAAKTRVLRVANFVDERIALGLTQSGDKFKDIARFEQMDDATLDGHIQATREFKANGNKVASQRISVAASADKGPIRMPSLGSVSAPVVDEDDPADDMLTFL